MFFENLVYIDSIKINSLDLSFTVYKDPVVEAEKDYFIYQTYQFNQNSYFKLATPSTNEQTKVLKTIASNKDQMKIVSQKVRHILNQGNNSKLTQCEHSELKESDISETI